jgi:diguanylate cyclase (GGDEF)-like protein/PAS domain S-box-containing protein
MRLELTDPIRVLFVCEEIEKLLGFPPQDWLSSRISLRDRLHPEDRDILGPLLAANLSIPSGSFHLRMRHADGRIRCLHGNYRKERQPATGPMLLEMTLMESGSEADKALQPIAIAFQALMDPGGDFMYLKDRNHAYIDATERMSILTKGVRDKSEFIGKTNYELFPEPLADLLHRREKQVFSEGKFSHEIQRLDFHDGSHRWIDNRKYPLKSETGTIVGLFGICPDITEPIDAKHRLRESREIFQLFIEHAPAALAMFDRTMRYLAVSRRWMHDFSLHDQEVIGRSHYEVFPEIPERWRVLHRRALAGEPLPGYEDSLMRADGSVQHLRREIHPWLTSQGEVGGILIFCEDITQQKVDQEQLQLAASVFTSAREGILICDPQGSILDVNDRFTQITGYQREEVLGRNPSILKSGRQSKEFYGDMWRALLENGQWSGELWNSAKDGRIYPEMLTIRAVSDRAGHVRHYVALFSDITEAKDQQRQIERIAHYDALTNVPNRTLLLDRLQQAMALAHRRGQMLAVACLDLDGFRAVNDRYGHEVGDDLLVGIAQRLSLVLREADSLARIGGDEFAAVLLDVGDMESALPLLDGLLSAVSATESGGEINVRVSASLGAVFYPQTEAVDAGQLLRQAGQAMYQAKLAGKNCREIFDPRRDLTIRASHEDVEQIRRALDADEFVLHYQPRVQMNTGAVIGAEALIRWRHPTRGLLLPGAFLPVVENHPLIDRLGEWVIRRALDQLEIWHAAGLRIPVSVNIAAHHLQQPGFTENLRSLLAAHPDIPPSCLELEVLETSALHDVTQVSRLLTACREIGVSIALDDFGTGYSSLTYLRRLPVNTLKIDQSFVRDMLDNPEDLSILEGVLGLATAFNRTAVAEGVETMEHGRLLLQLGCCYGQGFGIAWPMPAEDLPGWIAGWSPDPAWASASPVAPGRRGMLYAAVAHRAWAAAMESFLRGERRIPPPLDAHRCRFGRWLDSERSLPLGSATRFQEIDDLHREIHALAEHLSASESRASISALDAALRSLHRLRDALLAQIDLLLQENA